MDLPLFLPFEARGLTQKPEWAEFAPRLETQWEDLSRRFLQLYGHREDAEAQLAELVAEAFAAWRARPAVFQERDRRRPPASLWFQSQEQVGAVAYVDRWAGDFRALEARVPYLKELGVTYLHLMPFFLAPENESDGGYAVSSYRHTDPRLGTMDDVQHLAQVLDKEGIVLVADFVFNHTSHEHEWALKAREGDPVYQGYYWLFDHKDETAPWQAGLRDIFPETRKGSFTWDTGLAKWVWTTFNSFQWDLNYSNPEVLRAMARELTSLANRGLGILRLDAVAFVWKQQGTNCENLPGAHTLIQLFQAVARLACPSLLFLSEAIVHPDDIARYISPAECQLSYNPLLMAELWEASATKEVKLLELSLRTRHALPAGTAWVNYVRCHDDIGWTFADEDAAQVGINGYDHRQFLNKFYTGDFDGTFSRGVSFQHNPDTGDRRICGSAASLAGVEKARLDEDPAALQTALRRLTLLYGIAYSAGGLPLLYLGDELGVENWYGYEKDPAMVKDSRWVHRPLWSDADAAKRHDSTTVAGRVFERLLTLSRQRKAHAVFGTQGLEVLATGHPSVLAYRKVLGNQRLTVVGNFSETPVKVWAGVSGRDLLGSLVQQAQHPLELPACGLVWLYEEVTSAR
ncbi:MAG: amylosucrase [Spirochaetales bacterium]